MHWGDLPLDSYLSRQLIDCSGILERRTVPELETSPEASQHGMLMSNQVAPSSFSFMQTWPTSSLPEEGVSSLSSRSWFPSSSEPKATAAAAASAAA